MCVCMKGREGKENSLVADICAYGRWLVVTLFFKKKIITLHGSEGDHQVCSCCVHGLINKTQVYDSEEQEQEQ